MERTIGSRIASGALVAIVILTLPLAAAAQAYARPARGPSEKDDGAARLQKQKEAEEQAAGQREADERNRKRLERERKQAEQVKQAEAERAAKDVKASPPKKAKWTIESARQAISSALPSDYPGAVWDGSQTKETYGIDVSDPRAIAQRFNGRTGSGYPLSDIDPASVRLLDRPAQNQHARRVVFKLACRSQSPACSPYYVEQGFTEVELELPYMVDLETAQKVTEAIKAWVELGR